MNLEAFLHSCQPSNSSLLAGFPVVPKLTEEQMNTPAVKEPGKRKSLFLQQMEAKKSKHANKRGK